MIGVMSFSFAVDSHEQESLAFGATHASAPAAGVCHGAASKSMAPWCDGNRRGTEILHRHARPAHALKGH